MANPALPLILLAGAAVVLLGRKRGEPSGDATDNGEGTDDGGSTGTTRPGTIGGFTGEKPCLVDEPYVVGRIMSSLSGGHEHEVDVPADFTPRTLKEKVDSGFGDVSYQFDTKPAAFGEPWKGHRHTLMFDRDAMVDLLNKGEIDIKTSKGWYKDMQGVIKEMPHTHVVTIKCRRGTSSSGGGGAGGGFGIGG